MILFRLVTGNFPAGVDCPPSAAASILYAEFTLMGSSQPGLVAVVAVSVCLVLAANYQHTHFTLCLTHSLLVGLVALE